MRLPSIAAIFAFVVLSVSTPITAPVVPAQAAEARGTCPTSDYYVNFRGNCVHRPIVSNTAPRGATAQCRDGTYSFSQSRRGTCSHHGGVREWL
jgi:hypothetical protein